MCLDIIALYELGDGIFTNYKEKEVKRRVYRLTSFLGMYIILQQEVFDYSNLHYLFPLYPYQSLKRLHHNQAILDPRLLDQSQHRYITKELFFYLEADQKEHHCYFFHFYRQYLLHHQYGRPYSRLVFLNLRIICCCLLIL